MVMTTLGKSFVVLAFAGLVGCGGAGKSTQINSGGEPSHRGSNHAEIGKPAPELSIQSLNGKGKLSLDSLQGKIVIVDFWATWCAPCRASFPVLEGLSKKDNVVVIGVSADDEKSDILPFAKDTGATFPIGWDQGHTIAERWQVKNMPTTVILDGSGTVRYIHNGFHDGEAASIAKELSVLTAEAQSHTGVAKAKSTPGSKTAGLKTHSSGWLEPETLAVLASLAAKSASPDVSAEPEPEPVAPPAQKALAKKRTGGKTEPTKKPTNTSQKQQPTAPLL